MIIKWAQRYLKLLVFQEEMINLPKNHPSQNLGHQKKLLPRLSGKNQEVRLQQKYPVSLPRARLYLILILWMILRYLLKYLTLKRRNLKQLSASPQVLHTLWQEEPSNSHRINLSKNHKKQLKNHLSNNLVLWNSNLCLLDLLIQRHLPLDLELDKLPLVRKNMSALDRIKLKLISKKILKTQLKVTKGLKKKLRLNLKSSQNLLAVSASRTHQLSKIVKKALL